MKLIFLFVITPFLLHFIVATELPTFKCIADRPRKFHDTYDCKFRNVRLSPCNYNWIPTSNYYNHSLVASVDFHPDTFYNNSIPVITKNLCETFTKMLVLQIVNANVQRIEAGAFDACHNLWKLHLSNNKIRHLENNLFDNLVSLSEVHLDNNELVEFAPELVKNMGKLQTICLYSNNLKKFDIELMLNLNPKIYHFHIDDNPISCSRYKAIRKLSWELDKNSTYRIKLHYTNPKIREYPLDLIDSSFNCVPDVIYENLTINEVSNTNCEEVKEENEVDLNERLSKFEIKIENMLQKILMNLKSLERKIADTVC